MKKRYDQKWQRHFIKCLEGVPMIYEREPRKRSSKMAALAALTMSMVLDDPYLRRALK